jgi:hypothetical protein
VRVFFLALLVGCGAHAGGRGGSDGGGADLGASIGSPTVLATFDPAQLSGQFLALDSGWLYFETSGNLMRVATSGGKPSLVGTGLNGPYVFDAANAYGFDAMGIAFVPKSGGASTSLRKATQLGQHLAVDATSLYFHDYYGVRTNGDNYNQGIFQIALATGTVLNIATGQFVTGPFASDASNLYFFSDNSFNGEVRLMRVAKAGGSATILARANPFPDGPAFDGAALFWSSTGGWVGMPIPPSTLSSLPASGGTPSLLASPDAPGDIAVDANNIYFTNHDSALLKMPKSGGAMTTLAAPLMRPRSPVLDDKNVYWLDVGDGKILALPK